VEKVSPRHNSAKLDQYEHSESDVGPSTEVKASLRSM
jgi:hypothetical protein